jgi:hypothetical protein
MSDDLFGPNEKPVLSPGGKARYGRPLEEFAKVYGQSDRTIKRWIRTGKEAPTGSDLPPLESPGDMPAWWARHYKHRCPSEILEAARRSKPVTDTAPRPQVAVPAPAGGRQEQAPIEGSGFEEMLRRVRDAEADAHSKFLEVIRQNPDDVRIPALRKTWQEMAKQLRELERDAGEILEKSGQMASKSLVEKVLAEIHAPIAKGICTLWPRIKGRMLAAAAAEQDRIWKEESEKLIRALHDSQFVAYE